MIVACAACATSALAQPIAPALDEWGDEVGQWSAPHPGYFNSFGGHFGLEQDGEDEFMRFQAPVTDRQLFTQAVIPVPESAAAVQVTVEYRVTVDEVDGSESYHGPRIETGWWSEAIPFSEASAREDKTFHQTGQTVRENLDDSADGWQSFERMLPVPEGAAAITMRIGLINTSGTLDVRKIAVHVD